MLVCIRISKIVGFLVLTLWDVYKIAIYQQTFKCIFQRIFLSCSLHFVPKTPINVTIGMGIGLALNRRDAITWTINLLGLLVRRPKYSAWWRHQMETINALLAFCAGNSPVTGEFPAQRPVALSFHVFFDLRLSKRLSKQSCGWWSETPSSSLWRHCNGRNL